MYLSQIEARFYLPVKISLLLPLPELLVWLVDFVLEGCIPTSPPSRLLIGLVLNKLALEGPLTIGMLPIGLVVRPNLVYIYI